MTFARITILLTIIVAGLTGCATGPASPGIFATPPAPSATPPRKGDFRTAYAYALDRMAASDYAEGAVYFARAAEWVPPPGTEDRVWEFENWVNAAWASLLAGDKAGARQRLDRALSLEVQAAPSDRARYLDSLLSGNRHPALPPVLKNTLP